MLVNTGGPFDSGGDSIIPVYYGPGPFRGGSIGLNIFYFKRKRITNKPKAYEWLSRRKNKQYNKNILKTFIRIHSHYNRYTLLTYQVMRNKNHQATICLLNL